MLTTTLLFLTPPQLVHVYRLGFPGTGSPTLFELQRKRPRLLHHVGLSCIILHRMILWGRHQG